MSSEVLQPATIKHDSVRWTNALTESKWFITVSVVLITAIVFLPVFAAPPGHVISSLGNDGSQYFIFARSFGFDELRHGHLALWDPYIFSGCPFVGNWQSALLYPLNWIYLVLPVSTGMDAEAFVHTIIYALGMALWVRRTGISQLPSLAAGASVAFSGPYMLHIYAGHFSMIDSLAWAPWLFLALENILEVPTLRWTLLGSIFLALQVLAGHPQSVFGTVICSGIYVVYRLFSAPKRLQTLLSCIGIAVVALFLSSAQLVASLATKAESVRQVGVSYNDASDYSLSWSSFATLLAPKFFGEMKLGHPYWGSSFMWETSSYFGIAILAFAIFALIQRQKPRKIWLYLGMAIVFMLFSLAGHAPIFHLFYDYVPGFSQFRAQGRFIFFAGMFVALLAANGMESLLTNTCAPKSGFVFPGIGIVCLLLSLYCKYFGMVTHIHGALIKEFFYSNQALVASANTFAAEGMLVSCLVLTLIALILLFRPSRPNLTKLACVVSIAELTGYAMSTMVTFDIGSVQVPPKAMAFLQANPGNYRISNQLSPVDSAMTAKIDDIGGYDPSSLQRTTDFLDAARNSSADGPSPIYRLLRMRYGLLPGPGGSISGINFNNALPRAFFAPGWSVENGRDQVLNAVISNTKPDSSIPSAILESTPGSLPQILNDPSATISSKFVDTDTFTITEHNSEPGLIVITDPYSTNWHATVQIPGTLNTITEDEPILKCDWAFMAIPIPAPQNAIITFHYEPNGFKGALVVMAISWIVVIGALLFTLRTRRLAPVQ